MFLSSIKQTSRLINKGLPNIYLKLTIEKNRRFRNFDFLSLKTSSPGQFLTDSFGKALTHADTEGYHQRRRDYKLLRDYRSFT